jgi:hypothetical protein
MRRWIDRSVLHLGTRRIFPKEVFALPVCRRSYWSRDEAATAVGTDIFQNLFDARHTEGALIRANPHLKRIRRQRLVAMFAGRSEFEHSVLNVKLSKTRQNLPGTYFTPQDKTSYPFVFCSVHRHCDLFAGTPFNPQEDAEKGRPATLRLDLRNHARQASVIGGQTPLSTAQVPLPKHHVPAATSSVP